MLRSERNAGILGGPIQRDLSCLSAAHTFVGLSQSGIPQQLQGLLKSSSYFFLAWRPTQPAPSGPYKHFPDSQERALGFWSFKAVLASRCVSRPSQATSEDGFPLNCAHACSLQTLPFIIDSLALQTSRPRGLCSGGLETEHSQELPITLGMMPRANSQLSGNWNQASKHIHKRASRPQVALRRAGMHYLYCVCWQGRPIVTVGRPTLGAGDPGLYEREGGERQCLSLALCSGLWLRSAAVNPCYLDFLTRMTDCTRSKSGPFSLKTSSSECLAQSRE